MANKFQATDSRGTVHKRTSENRTYTHCVVVHYSAVPAQGNFGPWPASTKAEWAGRADLAEKNAARYRSNNRVDGVEVLTAERV